MMEFAEIARQNLLSPMVMAFGLGMVATFIRSDLKVPEPLHQSLSLYLLLAIGLKGGAQFAQTDIGEFLPPLGLTLILGFITPLLAFVAARVMLRCGRMNAGALAAHYGSVSAVTFIAANQFTLMSGLGPEPFLPALVVVLEIPGIAVGLMLAGGSRQRGFFRVLREAITGKGVILLLGGFAIGALSGPDGMKQVDPFFVAGFKGALVLFLLELGLTAARHLRGVRQAGLALPIFATLVPLILGLLGTFLGGLAGLGSGGAAVLGAMVSSASYIAAPAAVREALPDADPGLYLTASLGITFPFNLLVGIPIYAATATWLAS